MKNTKQRKPNKRRRKRRLKASIRRFSRQSIISIVAVCITILIFAYFAFLMILKGPSPTLSDLVISTMWESRRGKKIVRAYFTEDEIVAHLSKNSVDNANIIVVNNEEEFIIPEGEKDKIEIKDVSGPTYKGKMMIVRDPSRIDLGVNILMDSSTAKGYYVQDYCKEFNAIAGINAGGFEDPNGRGDGSIPYGVVIKDGKLIAGKEDSYVSLIGFNRQNHLIVGDMFASDALSWGIQNAVTFGPVLVFDGHPVTVTGTGGGLNPRTVIGQRADGSVLLLVIDGRQTTSLGASYEDCIQIMLDYQAVVAANLDGGSSSVMVYNDKIINNIVSMYGDRSVPTAWIVK